LRGLLNIVLGRGGSRVPTVDLVMGDIAAMDVDAIVNAADGTLLGGTDVDGAIRAAAGAALSEECRRIGGCRVGDAVATGGHALAARHVVHAVAPISAGDGTRFRLLESAYRRALDVADGLRARSVAFPLLGAGAFGWSFEESARAASAAVSGGCRHVALVSVVAFSPSALEACEAVFALRGRDGTRPGAALRYHPGACWTP